jgi:hypothetical protein
LQVVEHRVAITAVVVVLVAIVHLLLANLQVAVLRQSLEFL